MIRLTKAIGCAAFLNIYTHACSCFSFTKLVIRGIFLIPPLTALAFIKELSNVIFLFDISIAWSTKMFHLDTYGTLVAACLVLLLGRKLVQTVPFLKSTPFLNRLQVVCWWLL